MKESLDTCRIGGKPQEGPQWYYFLVREFPFRTSESGSILKVIQIELYTKTHTQTQTNAYYFYRKSRSATVSEVLLKSSC